MTVPWIEYQVESRYPPGSAHPHWHDEGPPRRSLPAALKHRAALAKLDGDKQFRVVRKNCAVVNGA